MVVPNKHGGGVRSKFNGANFLGLLYSKILKMANFFKNIKNYQVPNRRAGRNRRAGWQNVRNLI